MAKFEVTSPVDVRDILDSSINVAEILEQDDLDTIGMCVKEGFDSDERTRDGWVQQQEDMMKLALQVYEVKNTPWPNAANIKYPLLSTAAVRFAASAYPALVDSISPVKFLVKGEDLDGSKARRAIRLASHMSYQLIEEMDSWEEDTDRALFIASIVGCAFKKTYYDTVSGVNRSILVLPKDFVVDYWTRNLKTSRRYTHIMEIDTNYIYEQVAAGVFLDVELTDTQSQKAITRSNMLNSRASGEALVSEQSYSDVPRLLLEQYTYLDLDDDGYKEPYIVSVDYESAKVLRIVPRFDADSVFMSKTTRKILKIDADEYFTKIPFIPSPDGSFYDIGFGVLLGSINHSSNTILNLLVDAGTLSNRQSGFLAKGVRIKGGDSRFKPGEWKTVEAMANDLKNGIVPLPVREPSSILFALLQFLIESGNRLGSTIDMMVGENPGQNQKATTTLAVLEQGLKVYVAIHKRQFKAFKEEYKKLYKLNSKYLDKQEYLKFIDPNEEFTEETLADYVGEANDIAPNADTTIITEAQRLTKAEALLQLLPLGINVEETKRRVLLAQKQENIDALLQPNPPGPADPKVELEIKKLQFEAVKTGAQLTLDHIVEEAAASASTARALEALASARLKTAQANATDKTATLTDVQTSLGVIKAMSEREEQEEEQDVSRQLQLAPPSKPPVA